MAHEAGHFLMGVVFDVPNPKLGLSGFTHGPAPWLSNWQSAAIGIAGPAVTLALAAIGLAQMKSRSTRFAGALCVAACTRLCEISPFAVIALARWVRGAAYRRTTFDEARVFDLLGLNGDAALVFTSIILGAILFAALRRLPGETAQSLVIGALIGWGLWKIWA